MPRYLKELGGRKPKVYGMPKIRAGLGVRLTADRRKVSIGQLHRDIVLNPTPLLNKRELGRLIAALKEVQREMKPPKQKKKKGKTEEKAVAEALGKAPRKRTNKLFVVERDEKAGF